MHQVAAIYRFESELFQTATEAAWVFVMLPPEAADEIAEAVPRRPGFGSVRVVVQIGSTEWKTSLFPSKELGSYVLPVKRSVRDRERIDTGDSVAVAVRITED